MTTVKLAIMALVVSMASGCAAYRTSSNISGASDGNRGSVIITEGSLPGMQYTAISPIEVSVKKLTVFHEDPTREQANEVLREKALVIGADAVINVKYDKGVGFTTWGYMDAEGMAVKTNP